MIWTRNKDKDEYYLCIVTNTWFDSNSDIHYEEYDICNYVKCHWIKIDNKMVPDSVMKSLNIRGDSLLQV